MSPLEFTPSITTSAEVYFPPEGWGATNEGAEGDAIAPKGAVVRSTIPTYARTSDLEEGLLTLGPITTGARASSSSLSGASRILGLLHLL